MRGLEPGDPRSIGRYRILARIGAGGMAVVYFGRSAGGRAVAIKVVHAEFSADPEHRDRFRHEVAATRAVGGGYGPGVLDADPDAGMPWMATEFLPSVSLREAVRLAGPLPADSVWALAAGIAEVLVSIHRAGIAHLDLTPANVLLTSDGLRVIDFGIAVGTLSGPVDLGGTPAGSRGFMSPEQVVGAQVGPASDIFSFGATLAYACTGTAQSEPELTGIADDALRTMIEHCLRSDPPARPTLPDLTGYLASATSGTPGVLRLRPDVTAEIDRRASEAANPPVAVPSPPGLPKAPAWVHRRVLLLGIGAVAVVGGAAEALASLRPEPEVSQPTPDTTSASPSATLVSTPKARTLEFFVFGKTTLRSLTTTVNGQAVTVNDLPLPYRRVVDIPQWPERSTWRVDYHHTAGEFMLRVIVDGIEHGGAGSSSTRDDIQDHSEGVI